MQYDRSKIKNKQIINIIVMCKKLKLCVCARKKNKVRKICRVEPKSVALN